MLPVKEFVQGLQFAAEVVYENLTMTPVLAGAVRPEPGYMLLGEALEAKLAKVTELGGGVVPELLFENMADCPVLILGGEELVGAKQNRMVNLTILAAPKSKMVIPVSCVEAGRWQMATTEFEPSRFMAFSALRAGSTSQVTESMFLMRSRRSDQSQVWCAIDDMADQMDAHSGTSAMRAIFERRLSDVEEFVRAMRCVEGQVGAAFLIDGEPAGIDVFDHPRTMEKMRDRLVRGYALDALAKQRARKRRGGKGKRTSPAGDEQVSAAEVVKQWLTAIDGGETLIMPGVGMGQDVRIKNTKFTAAALWADSRFVHFCAFPGREPDHWHERVY
jgi:hypothetical protein